LIEKHFNGPDYFKKAATLQNCARVEMPLKMPRARAKTCQKKNTGNLEQNEELHASTSQNPHFLHGTLYFS